MEINMRIRSKKVLAPFCFLICLALSGCNEISLKLERVNGKTSLSIGPDGSFPALKFALGVLNIGVFPVSDQYTTDDDITITATDGVNLEANIFVPNTIPVGGAPAIILINSWTLNEYQYLAEAGKLAEKGYIVLSYSTRGFGQSGGEIDTAGSLDLDDFSKVIDYLVANYPVDPSAIGSGGISYGSGISVLGAAHDSRVKAVVALSSWGSLADALFGNSTPRLAWGEILVMSGQVLGNPSAIVTEYWNALKAEDWAREAEIRAWAGERSPLNYVTELNANNPAIYFGKSYGDNMFQPNSLLELFSQLTVPKHIDLVQGTHASAEMFPSIMGLETNYLWDNAFNWFDIHLKGEVNALSTASPIRMKVKFQEQYDSFNDFPVSANEDTFYLHSRGGSASGQLSTATFTRSATDTINSRAGSWMFSTHVPAISQYLEQTNIPVYTAIPLASKKISIAFKTETLSETMKIRGNPSVSLMIQPDNDSAQLVAYLYDVNNLGIGKLITHGVTSLRSLVPNAVVRVDFDLVTTAYDVPVGNKLVLAFDTKDAQYMTYANDAYNINFNFNVAEQSILIIPKP